MFIYSRSPEKMKHNSHVLCPENFTPALQPAPYPNHCVKKKPKQNKTKQIKVATAIAYN